MTTFILFEFAIGYLIFGLYVLFKNKSSLQNRMFFSLCIHLFSWSLGYSLMMVCPSQSTANFWRLVAAFGWCFAYSVWLDFAILVQKESMKWMSSIKRLFIYIPGLFFFIGNFTYEPSSILIKVNNHWRDKYPISFFQILFMIYYPIFVIKGLLIIYNWGKNATSKKIKIQSKIITTTTSITFIIAALIDTILPLFHIDLFPIGIMIFPVILLGIWHAMVKYKLLSINSEIASEYIMNTINNPVTIMGNDLSIKEVNLAALKFIGYSNKELSGMPLQKILPNTDLNNIAFTEFIKSGFIKNIEIDLLTKGNKFITCLVSASSIYNDSKDLVGVVAIFNDITDRKNAESALKESHQELERRVSERTSELTRSNLLLQAEISERKKIEELNQQIAKTEALGTLAGGIAHDFNNILAGILGYTQLTLEDLTIYPDLSDNLLEVLKLGNRAKNLISQILTFSRKTILEPIIVDMNLIIVEVLNMIKATTPASVDIKYSFSGDYPFVFADPGEMNQLIMNLCTNAKLSLPTKDGLLQVLMTESLMDQDMKLQYQITENDMYIKIQVIDNGCGMDKSTIQRVFEPFYTTREVQCGTGLGLSVVHGILKSYGGIITIDSELNKGSTFTVFLPRAK